MEEIDKKMQKRLDIFNENLIQCTKEEKEKNKISLRKQKIQNIIMKKRYLDNYSNIDFNLNKKDNNAQNRIHKEYMIDISSFLIKEELKKKDIVESIILENNFDTIFGFINEIYKENNFQIDILKYGLFLLNEKLLRYSREEGNNEDNNIKLINEIIKFNIEDIILKLLSFSQNEIKKNDNDHIILNLAYQILVNYSYLANDSQIRFLLNQKMIEFHLYFLRYSSEEENIINIYRMLYNLSLYNDLNIYLLLNYNNNELVNISNDYITSSIKTGKINIVEKILDIYFCYINIIDDNIKDNSKYINIRIFNEIYLIVLQTIFIKNNYIFTNSIYIIGTIFKILFKSKDIKNNIDILAQLLLENNSKSMLILILDFDYSDSAENIIYLCNIICYLIKSQTYSNNLLIKNKLEKLINEVNNFNNINGDEIIILITNMLRKNYTKKIFSKLINVLIALCDSEKYYISLFENLSNPVLILIDNIDCRIYKIKKKVLFAIEKLTEKQEIKINNELIKYHIFNKIKYAIDPDDAYCRDEDIIIISLNIIHNLLKTGEIMESLGGKNNSLEAFGYYGGKEMIEKFLNMKNKSIYEKALEIYSEYFNKKEE